MKSGALLRGRGALSFPQSALDIFANQPLRRNVLLRGLSANRVEQAAGQAKVNGGILRETLVALEPFIPRQSALREIEIFDIVRIEKRLDLIIARESWKRLLHFGLSLWR